MDCKFYIEYAYDRGKEWKKCIERGFYCIPTEEVHVVADGAEIAVYVKLGLLRAFFSVPCIARYRKAIYRIFFFKRIPNRSHNFITNIKSYPLIKKNCKKCLAYTCGNNIVQKESVMPPIIY